VEVVNQLKLETALELGVTEYPNRYKGDFPSSVNVAIGVHLKRKLKVLSQRIKDDPNVLTYLSAFCNGKKEGG
jgi:hypothetical protein